MKEKVKQKFIIIFKIYIFIQYIYIISLKCFIDLIKEFFRSKKSSEFIFFQLYP